MVKRLPRLTASARPIPRNMSVSGTTVSTSAGARASVPKLKPLGLSRTGRIWNGIGIWNSILPRAVPPGISSLGSIASLPNGRRRGPNSCRSERSFSPASAVRRKPQSPQRLDSNVREWKRHGASSRGGTLISSLPAPAVSRRKAGDSSPLLRQGIAKERNSMLRLVITHGNEERVFAVPEGEAKLGSAQEMDLVVRASGVSRRHALVRQVPGGIEVVDLGSKNGLVVEGQRVLSVVLAPGQWLQIGTAWLGIEEISSSEESLALMIHSPSRRGAHPSFTAGTLASAGGLTSRGPADTALAFAYRVLEMGAG